MRAANSERNLILLTSKPSHFEANVGGERTAYGRGKARGDLLQVAEIGHADLLEQRGAAAPCDEVVGLFQCQ